MSKHLCFLTWLILFCGSRPGYAVQDGTPRLENDRLAMRFDGRKGNLIALRNKLTGETYRIRGDEFSVEAATFRLGFAEATLRSLELRGDTLHVRYEKGALAVEVVYTLRPDQHFAEKRLVVTCDHDYTLKRIIVTQPSFRCPGLSLVPYPYQKNVTYFGRTPSGGFFTGLELPFGASSAQGNQVTLAYVPSLQVKRAEPLACEPVYFGVYRRRSGESEDAGLPLQSESDAMVAMTSAILGPPRHGLVPLACGWLSEMEHFAYGSEQRVQADIDSMKFLVACGIDWLSASHPWGGETEKMNALVEGQRYVLGSLPRKFLEQANALGVKIIMWPTLNNTHPWWREKGRAFRPDKPEWIMDPVGKTIHHKGPDGRVTVIRNRPSNCFANGAFREWLTGIQLEGMATGYYAGWAIDGSFLGHGGETTWTIPANCSFANHGHVPGDSNYACERALNQLAATIREHHPQTYIFFARPPMDLGVWSLRNGDACFTLHESGQPKELEGLSDQPVNVILGDKIRTWSRIRVHRHFYPHYLDAPVVFPMPKSMQGRFSLPWPSEKIDYILLSALSCSPNQVYYMPTKAGIPDEDKETLRKWLAWGRKNIRFLQIRKDLPDWPAAGRVDGSAHMVDDRGFIFLFNPNHDALVSAFRLAQESIGVTGSGNFSVSQVYPASDQRVVQGSGGLVKWSVPGEAAVLLEVAPVQ